MFLQTDPIPGGSCNPYDYTCQDPINRLDLSGKTYLSDGAGPINNGYCPYQQDWCFDTSNYLAERGLTNENLWNTTPLEASLAADGVCMLPGVRALGCGAAQALALRYRWTHNHGDDPGAEDAEDVLFTAGSFVMLGLPLGVAEHLIAQYGGKGGVLAVRFVGNLPDFFAQFGDWLGQRQKG